jgi:hypothetical protein
MKAASRSLSACRLAAVGKGWARAYGAGVPAGSAEAYQTWFLRHVRPDASALSLYPDGCSARDQEKWISVSVRSRAHYRFGSRSRAAPRPPASNHTPTYRGARRRGIGPAKINLVQRRERSRGKGNSRSCCAADRRIDARPQSGKAPDGKRRSHPCTSHLPHSSQRFG